MFARDRICSFLCQAGLGVGVVVSEKVIWIIHFIHSHIELWARHCVVNDRFWDSRWYQDGINLPLLEERFVFNFAFYLQRSWQDEESRTSPLFREEDQGWPVDSNLLTEPGQGGDSVHSLTYLALFPT